MRKFMATICAIALAVTACGLAACTQADGSASSGSVSATDDGVRAGIEEKLSAAHATSYDNVTFAMQTETSATGTGDNDEIEQQAMTTSMNGELDKSGDKPAVHVSYEATSSTRLEKTAYDMFIDKDGMIISQAGLLFKEGLDDEALQGYASSVTAEATKEEASQLLDIASSFKMEESDGDTVITIVANADKLAESSLVDTSTLPEGASIATLVASYTIDSNNRFKAIRLMSSTTGSPTYRVDQSYRFTGYDETALPEWPDYSAFLAEQAGILTDDDGRLYMVGDDGQIYYIDSIDDDGTIHFAQPEAQVQQGSYYEYLPSDDESAINLYDYLPLDTAPSADDPGGTDSAAPETPEPVATETEDSNAGRAFINVGGTKYYLDEPGSRIEDVGSGVRAFYPADGSGPYFISG